MSRVAAGETGVLPVFAIDLPDKAAGDFVAVDPASGSPSRFNTVLVPEFTLDPDFVEAFVVSDLHRFGHADLVAYVSGASPRPADLAHNARALREVAGWVVLLWSGAFGGRAAAVHPIAPIRLLATLRLADPAPRPRVGDAPFAPPRLRAAMRTNLLPADPRRMRNAITGLALAGVVALATALVYLGIPG